MKINHSKYSNSGILFELLTRQVTSDILSNKNSEAINILKSYFVKTELGKEYRLYESLLKKTKLSEAKAKIIIDTILEQSKFLNRSLIKRQKYNLVKEIKNHYNTDEFFKTKLPNYKAYAALYTLIEITNSQIPVNSDVIISNKISLLEYLTVPTQPIKTDKSTILEEFSTYDKDLRTLTYKVVLNKFNEKYSGLNENQKLVLKEYITSVDSKPKLLEFYNNKIDEIKVSLLKLNESVTDKTVNIKINEVSSLIKRLGKNDKVGDDNLVNLLNYYELLEQLTLIHKN